MDNFYLWWLDIFIEENYITLKFELAGRRAILMPGRERSEF